MGKGGDGAVPGDAPTDRVAEIKSEMAALKSAGKHHLCVGAQKLRAEWKTLEPGADTSWGQFPPPPDATPKATMPIEAFLDAPPPAEVPTDGPSVREALEGFEEVWSEEKDDVVDPYDSDEWSFIQQCLAELKIDLQGGISRSLAKKLYMLIRMKVKMWRMLRGVVARFGIGEEWPAWNTLGLDDSKGEPKKEKPPLRPLPPAPIPTPEMAPAAPAAPVAPPMDELEQHKLALKADIASHIAALPEPERGEPVLAE